MTQYKSIFIDTWGWVVLGQKSDQYHAEVKNIYEQIIADKTIIHTSDYVLDELMTILFKREAFEQVIRFMNAIFISIDRGQIKLHSVTYTTFFKAWELRKSLDDKPLISFTDLTSMIIMKEQNIQYVLTQDKHFIQVGMNFIRVPNQNNY